MLSPLRVLASQEVCPSLEDEMETYENQGSKCGGIGRWLKPPTYYIRMIKGLLLRHRIATPPLAYKLAFWRRAPFPVVFVRFLGQLPRFSGWALVQRLYELEKAGKVDLCFAATLPKCGAASAWGPGASTLAVLPNCTRG